MDKRTKQTLFLKAKAINEINQLIFGKTAKFSFYDDRDYKEMVVDAISSILYDLQTELKENKRRNKENIRHD